MLRFPSTVGRFSAARGLLVLCLLAVVLAAAAAAFGKQTENVTATSAESLWDADIFHLPADGTLRIRKNATNANLSRDDEW
jgi:hypothetical protein